MQCRATATSTRRRCKRPANPGSDYCSTHQTVRPPTADPYSTGCAHTWTGGTDHPGWLGRLHWVWAERCATCGDERYIYAHPESVGKWWERQAQHHGGSAA